MNTPHRHIRDSIELEKSFSENYWQVQDQDIICLPSLTFNSEDVAKITGNIHYEERQLFNILLLKNPSTRLIYISSIPLDPSIINYYLSLIPGSSREDLLKRLTILSTNDISNRPLAEKVLERPLLIERIKKLVRPNHAMLLCFTCTDLESEIAKKLGVPIFGNDTPEMAYWGSKSGSREIFQEAEIPHARGVSSSRSSNELAKKIVTFFNEKSVKKLVVKLNHGFSGQGNALLDLSEYYKTGQLSEANVLESMSKMHYYGHNSNWEEFQRKIEMMGVIAEEFFEGEDPTSPSVQGCISMNGDVEILSTHEQVLNNQIYQGCMFPASDQYRALLKRYGRRVGRLLAKNGVRGHFGVDFLVNLHQSPSSSPAATKEGEKADPNVPQDIYALEINLRQCGTTHPYFTMKFLTDGVYDKKTGLCNSSKGGSKYYTSSDNLHKDNYKCLLPQDVLDGFKERGLLFDTERQTGIVFHLLGALSEHGKVGVTCVEDSPEAGSALFAKAKEVLEEISGGCKPASPRHFVLQSESPLSHAKSEAPATKPAQAKQVSKNLLTHKKTFLKFGDWNSASTTKMLITVCIHGDEVCGLLAVNELIEEGYFERTLPENIALTITVGNPLAYVRQKRFVDQNLNRVFLPHMFEKGGYETFRARNICQSIIDCDYYLDIHSTSAVTPSMALPAANPLSQYFAATFPVDYVILDLVHATQTRGTSVDWAFFHKKIGVSVECGQHTAASSVLTAKNSITHFIATQLASNPSPTLYQPRILKCLSSEKVRPGFRYKTEPLAFDFIKYGQVVAEDNEVGELHCDVGKDEGGAYLVMPTKIPYVGEEAYYWAIPYSLEEAEDK